MVNQIESFPKKMVLLAMLQLLSMSNNNNNNNNEMNIFLFYNHYVI